MATILHDSDCAQHNEPAIPNGPCDCGADKMHTNEELCEALAEQRRSLSADHDRTLSELTHLRKVTGNEIARLSAIILEQAKYADGCMEGAGEPEFSQFSVISGACRKALRG